MLLALIGAEGRGQHDAGVVDEDVGADGTVFETVLPVTVRPRVRFCAR
jgi:hypothetical protein